MRKYTAEIEIRQTMLVKVEASSASEARRIIRGMSADSARHNCQEIPDLPGEESVHLIQVWSDDHLGHGH